jgi:hypothetical protein
MEERELEQQALAQAGINHAFGLGTVGIRMPKSEDVDEHPHESAIEADTTSTVIHLNQDLTKRGPERSPTLRFGIRPSGFGFGERGSYYCK